MATKIASVYAEIGAETSGLKRGLSEAKTGLSGIGKQFQALTGLSLSWAAAIGVGVEALRFSINQAKESELADAKLNAVLEATGGIAGLTSAQLGRLANSLSRTTGVDDELIQSAEAVLLTFRQIGRDVFPEAMEAALDMSAVLGQDLQGSIVQIGKALNDPIRGFSALQRVGVTFNDEQRAMITNLQNSGDLLGAQTIILDELQTEFGGAAEAMGDTYAGSINKLKNAWGNLGEAVGGKIIPVLANVVTFMANGLTRHEQMRDAFEAEAEEVYTTANSYEAYREETIAAAIANGQLTESQAALLRAEQDTTAAGIGLASQIGLMNELTWQHINYQEAFVTSMVAVQHGVLMTAETFQPYAQRLGNIQNAYQNVITTQEALNAAMDDFAQDTGNRAAQTLQQWLVPASDRYATGLQTIDEVMGTNLYTMNEYQLALEDAGRQYASTGDMDTYKQKLQDIKAEYGDFMTSELQTAADTAQAIYSRLIGLPQTRHVSIRFDASGDPRLINFILGGAMGLPEITYANSQTLVQGGGSKASTATTRSGFGDATGGNFTIGPGYSNDTYPMWFSSGEKVHVTTRSEGIGGNSGGGNVINFNITGDSPREIADEIMRMLELQGVNA